jgi:hypothetical protein
VTARSTVLWGVVLGLVLGCGSSRGKPAETGGGGAGGNGPPSGAAGAGGVVQQSDAGGDSAPASDGPTDAGFEAPPLPYFYGTCSSFKAATPVPTDQGPLPYGLTVLATGLPRTVSLEVDATNAYLATSGALMRLPLAGGTPVTMVAGAAPIATAIDATNVYWIDGGVTGQTTILRAPLTATNWVAFAGDGGGAQAATTLATQTGDPGAFTVAGGYVYFAVGSAVSRVPTGGGTVQTVETTYPPTGMAVGGDALYLGEYSGETIQRVPLTGTLPATPSFLKMAYVVPTELVLNGGDLYWGDWYGGAEYYPTATPAAGQRYGTNCSGGSGPCKYRFRAGGPGAIWTAPSDECGSLGKVNPSGSELMAGGLGSFGGIAADATHAYATTSLGELLRWDL